MVDPVFVSLSGKQVLFTSLPKGTQDALRKANIEQTVTLSKTLDTFNSPFSTAREKIGARETLIKSGVEGTALHLGAPTKEVIAQLQASADQQNFSDKRDPIIRQIQELEARGIVSGNTSGKIGQAQSKAKAQQVFSIQQQFTQAKTGQVREVLDSPEFAMIKAEGGDIQGVDLAGLLTLKGVAVPKFQTEIVNEIAQADIQGDVQTAQNINQILSKSGFTEQVTVKQGVLSGLQANPILADTQSNINKILTGTPITDFGFVSTDPLEGLTPQGLGFFGAGESLPEATDADFDIKTILPFIVLGVIAIAVIFLITRGKP